MECVMISNQAVKLTSLVEKVLIWEFENVLEKVFMIELTCRRFLFKGAILKKRFSVVKNLTAWFAK